jgi:protein PhnA
VHGALRNISLVPENAAHIEVKVEWQRIVILTEFVKRKWGVFRLPHSSR